MNEKQLEQETEQVIQSIRDELEIIPVPMDKEATKLNKAILVTSDMMGAVIKEFYSNFRSSGLDKMSLRIHVSFRRVQRNACFLLCKLQKMRMTTSDRIIGSITILLDAEQKAGIPLPRVGTRKIGSFFQYIIENCTNGPCSTS
jgi:hypothetical protein